MRQLEIFFDYACPYCYEGLEYLRELIERLDKTDAAWFGHTKTLIAQGDERIVSSFKLVWIPCEAHPRPERYGVHSDIAVQGFYYARENGIGAWAYNDRIFRAIFAARENIENAGVVAACLEDLGADADGFLSAFKDGRYADLPGKNNRLAWGANRLHAVPSYKLDGRILGSRDGLPVTKSQLAAFLG